MDETAPIEIDDNGIVGAVASAMGEIDRAIQSLSETVGDLQSGATADADTAAAAAGVVTDGIIGSIANTLDRIDAPVVKALTRALDSASTDHASAINRLFSIGAQPLYTYESIAADIQRGDPYLSAVEQILRPITDPSVDRIAPVAIDAEAAPPPPVYTSPTVCPYPMPEPEPCPPCTTAPPPPPEIDQPPYSSGSCPPPVVQCPTPPPPVVYLLPGPTIPPTVPTTPPTVPTVPPTSPPISEGEETAPPVSPEPPPVVVIPPVVVQPQPPAPVKPPPPTFTPTIRPVGVGVPAGRSSWDAPDRCATIKAIHQPPPAGKAEDSPLIGGLGVVGAGLDGMFGGILSGLFSGSGTSVATGVSVFGGVLEWAQRQVNSLATAAADPATGANFESLAVLAGAGWTERLTCIPAQYLAQGYLYDLQYSSPQLLPSQAQVNQLKLANTITADLWECLTRANGYHPWAQKLLLDAARERPSSADLISLYRRGQLGYQGLLVSLFENGVTKQSDADKMIAAGEFVPPYTDLTRFMVRDSADDAVVAAFGYDNGFEQKYAGPIKDWARAQGISEDVFRYIWRAHWQLPSPTQLYEMLHRLRPGRVPAEQAVTADRVKQTLVANDLAPAYVDSLMAVSYNNITRTDILSFYVNGSMKKEEVVERLQDLGYTQPDSARIADSWETEKANRVQNRARLWTRNNIVRHYIAGTIDRQTATDLLVRSIPDIDERIQILSDADMMRKAKRREKCVKAIRKRRVTGELNEAESRAELIAQGMDAEVAAEIAEGWSCEIVSMAREPTVKMLTDWFLHGIIDVTTLDKRLRNLRFSPKDAESIIKEVVAEWNERMERQAQAAARRAAAEEVRRRKEAERLAEKRKKRAACLLKGGTEETC